MVLWVIGRHCALVWAPGKLLVRAQMGQLVADTEAIGGRGEQGGGQHAKCPSMAPRRRSLCGLRVSARSVGAAYAYTRSRARPTPVSALSGMSGMSGGTLHPRWRQLHRQAGG